MTYLTRNQGQRAEQVFLQLQFPAVCHRVREMQVEAQKSRTVPQDFSVQGLLHSYLFNTEFENTEYNVNIKGQKQKQKEEKMLRRSQFFGTDIPELLVSMEMIGNCSE